MIRLSRRKTASERAELANSEKKIQQQQKKREIYRVYITLVYIASAIRVLVLLHEEDV